MLAYNHHYSTLKEKQDKELLEFCCSLHFELMVKRMAWAAHFRLSDDDDYGVVVVEMAC